MVGRIDACVYKTYDVHVKANGKMIKCHVNYYILAWYKNSNKY